MGWSKSTQSFLPWMSLHLLANSVWVWVWVDTSESVDMADSTFFVVLLDIAKHGWWRRRSWVLHLQGEQWESELEEWMEKRVWLRGSWDLIESGKTMVEDIIGIAIDDNITCLWNDISFLPYCKLKDMVIYKRKSTQLSIYLYFFMARFPQGLAFLCGSFDWKRPMVVKLNTGSDPDPFLPFTLFII